MRPRYELPPDNVESCPLCEAPIRTARVMAAITVKLDATSSSRGCFFYTDATLNRVVEDPMALTLSPRFTRHRCSPPWRH